MTNNDIFKIISPDRYDRMLLRAYYQNQVSLWHGSDYLEYIIRIQELELKTGIIMSDSPSHRNLSETVKTLEPVKVLPRPDVSVVNSLEEVMEFAHKKPLIMSWKLDGQPLILHYKDGKFQQAIVSHPGSTTGYDVSHAAKQMKWVPIRIPSKDDLTICGTAVINWPNYNLLTYYNELELIHPALLAKRSVHSRDGGTAKHFRLEFIAYHMLTNEPPQNKTAILSTLDQLGFTTVDHWPLSNDLQIDQFKQLQKQFTPFNYQYPVSGLILEYNDSSDPKAQPALDTQRIAVPWDYDVHTRENVLMLRLLNDLDTPLDENII